MFQDDNEKKERTPLESEVAKGIPEFELPATEEVPTIPSSKPTEASVPPEADATEVIVERKEEPRVEKEEEPKVEEKPFRLVDYYKICIWLKIEGDRQIIDATEPKILKDRLEARLFQFGSKFVSVVYEGESPYIYKLSDRGDNTVLNYRTTGIPLRRLEYHLMKRIGTTRKSTSSRLQ